jgi:hypothetical protein
MHVAISTMFVVMLQKIVSTLITTTLLALVFAGGRLIYLRYFGTPERDFTEGIQDLGEDSPVIEALLAMRERYAAEGNHFKALEYSTKALERCPDSERIKELHQLDQRNCVK